MPTLQKVKRFCLRCQGSGHVIQYPFVHMDASGVVYEPYEINCPECTGEGLQEFGQTEEIRSRCTTSIILENTDSNEYTALDATKKAWYNLYISAGTLDMTVNTKAYNLFLAWIFPSGTSHDAIMTALAALD